MRLLKDFDSLLASILIILTVLLIIFVCSTTRVDDTLYSMDSTTIVTHDTQRFEPTPVPSDAETPQEQ